MNNRKGLRISEITPLLHFFIAGILCGEAYAASKIVANILNKGIARNNWEYLSIIPCLAAGTICLLYIKYRGANTEAKKFLKSQWYDVGLAFIAGGWISFDSNGLASTLYAPLLEKMSFSQAIFYTALPLAFASIALLKARSRLRKITRNNPACFLSDSGIKHIESDLLEINERARIFAERVLNGGAPDSIVFGVDAPWGTGKTSFLDLCCTYWNELQIDKPIVLKFEPLRYEDGADLTQKFIDELISTLQQNIFAPSLRPLFKRYEKLIENRTVTSLLNVHKTLLHNGDTVESVYDEIAQHLEQINSRIIVIIDDLDRLHWSSIKNILFSIKRSFTLPNTSYIFCYDTNNIKASTDNPDSEKTVEFLEKFISIKTSLFLNSKDLSKYLTKHFKNSITQEVSLPDASAQQLDTVIQKLAEIINGNDFHHYTPFIGDLRKIKRFINTLILLDIGKTDFREADINKEDLIHLTLIYIHYPTIFRKIYNCETSGKTGGFCISEIAGNVENSPFYKAYKESLGNDNERFLLSRIFETEKKNSSSFTEYDRASRAIFQGEKRPLEKYLYLIGNLSRPLPWESLQSYLNKKNLLLKSADVTNYLEKISSAPPLDKEKGQGEFWRIVTNHIGEFPPEHCLLIISYLIEKLPNHSLLKSDDLSELRKTIVRLIARILDTGNIKNEKKSNSNSALELELRHIIFGNKKQTEHGILEKLANKERGALGFHDLLTFRACCIQKSNSERLWRAVNIHTSTDISTTSNYPHDEINQARAISQHVFRIFNKLYISTKKNILSEIDSLPEKAFFGRYEERYQANECPPHEIEHQKQEIKRSLIEQLGNKIVRNCGIYDEETAENNNHISILFTNYLFNVCFNPEDERGLIHFGDYLISFSNEPYDDSDNPEYQTNLNTITNNVDKMALAYYWKNNREKITSVLSSHANRIVYKEYSKPTFGKNLPPIYRALDNLLSHIPEIKT